MTTGLFGTVDAGKERGLPGAALRQTFHAEVGINAFHHETRSDVWFPGRDPRASHGEPFKGGQFNRRKWIGFGIGSA